MEDSSVYSGRLRKRKRPLGDGSEESLNRLLELVEGCGKLLIFSGSGLSANSGMSMFTTKNGLYERARSKFKIQDGMKLFSYPFYKQRRKDLQAFFAQIYSEAQSSRAAPGHVAIAELHKMGRLQRHYTLNIDGLAAAVGMDTWHHEHNPEGSTVEMHGNISYVVCPECHAVQPLDGSVMETMKACQPVVCTACSQEEMRFKVMLYDDEQGDCITPEDVFERLDDDLAVAGAVIWVGISFEQSASTEYFRKVRHMLSSHGRLHEVTQVILNPSEEPYFNVMSTMSNKEDVKVLDVRATSDDALPRVVEHLHQLGGTSPDSAAMQAAAEAAQAAAAARLRRKLEQEQAAAPVDGHCTPRMPSTRRRRASGSMAGSPADRVAGGGGAAAAAAAQARQRDQAASPSYAELAAMDSAAAAALSLPAAVQKHFAQKQLQMQLQNSGAGVKVEAAAAAQRASLGRAQEQPLPVASAAEQQPAAAASSQPCSAPQGALQQAGGAQANLQQLLGQLQAVQALQSALAAPTMQQQQLQHPAAASTGPGLPQALGVSPMLAAAAAAGMQAPLLNAQLPGVHSLLATVLAKQQAALQAASTTVTQQQPPPAGNSNALAAAAVLLASSPAAASLLLSNPTMLAALAAASNGAGHSNGAPAPVPAAAAAGSPVEAAPCVAAEPEFTHPAAQQGTGSIQAAGQPSLPQAVAPGANQDAAVDAAAAAATSLQAEPGGEAGPASPAGPMCNGVHAPAEDDAQ